MIDFISPLELWGTYIFRTMLIGTTLIGVFSGVAGCLLYLRRQSLVSDVIGHSSILGVVAAFTVATLLGGDGRSMVVLVLGAGAAGAYLSVCLGKVPTGPVVVIHLFVIFAASLLAAPRRSIVVVALRQRRLRGDLVAQARAAAAVPADVAAATAATHHVATTPGAPAGVAASAASERSER